MILGGSERYAQGKDWSKIVFKVIFLDIMAFPMHINVRLKTFSRIPIYASALPHGSVKPVCGAIVCEDLRCYSF